MKSDRGWKRRFDDPIPLPRGRQLVTLEDAGNYITKLPKAEYEAAEWVAAMRCGTNARLFILESKGSVAEVASCLGTVVPKYPW